MKDAQPEHGKSREDVAFMIRSVLAVDLEDDLATLDGCRTHHPFHPGEDTRASADSAHPV